MTAAKDLKFVVVKIDNKTGKRTVKLFDYTQELGIPTHRGREHWDGAPAAMEKWVNDNSTGNNTIIICEPTKIVTRPGTPVWTPTKAKDA